jgi:intracellular septation protein
MQNNTLIEMIPLAAFFICYYLTHNLFHATFVCIIASWLALGLNWAINRKVANSIWLSTGLITILGTLTIALHNKTFIMLKPTVLYFAFAICLYISDKVGKNLIKALLHGQIELSFSAWQQLNWLWIGFFIVAGVLNLFIAFNFSEYLWVKFKVFGGIALFLANSLVTAGFIYSKTRNKING